MILMGGDLSLQAAEMRGNIGGALIGGAVHALFAGPEDEEPLGVAIWYPPGKSVFSRCVAGLPLSLHVPRLSMLNAS